MISRPAFNMDSRASVRRLTNTSLGQKRPAIFVHAMNVGKILLKLPCHVAHLLKILLVKGRRIVLGLVRFLRESVLCERHCRLER